MPGHRLRAGSAVASSACCHLPYEHVPAFIARLRAKKGISALALEFTILTAVSTSEAIGAAFNEFDLAAKMWTIPAERMKTEKEHRVPLAPRGVAIVKELVATRLNEFVFPGLKRGKPLSSLAMLMMLRDMHPGITVHGFRRAGAHPWENACRLPAG